MQKKSFDEYLTYVARIVFMTVFIVAISYFVIYSVRSKLHGMIPGNVRYLTQWECSYNGGMRQKVDLPVKIEAGNGVSVSYECELPVFIAEGSWLAFPNSKDVLVLVNGAERFSWSSESVDIPGGPVKSIFMYVPLYSIDAGAKVTIIKRGKTDNGVMPFVLIGDSLSVTNELMIRSGLIPFIIALIMFFLSSILVISCLILQRIFKQKFNLISIGIAVMGVSAWLVFDSNVFQLAVNIKYIDGFLSYILTFIIIFPFIIYIDNIQEHRYRRVYAVLCLIEIVSMCVFTALHILGVYNFAQMLLPIDVIIAWIAVIVCGCTVIDVVSKKASGYKYVAYGLLAFLLLTIVEIALVNADIERVDGVLILVGMVILVVSAISQQFYDIKIVENKTAAVIEADKARNDFLAKMSHEFRTPINSIMGMNEMILDENQDPSIREYAKRIERSGKVLLNMVEDILDYSKLQNDQFESVYEDYHVRKMLDKVVSELKENASLNNLGVNYGVSGDIPAYLNGDEWYIQRVLDCLISNAVKYTESGSVTFTVECEKVEDRYSLIFVVSDTGIGIKDEDMGKLFKPFVRGDLRSNRSTGGAGLGLAIAKRLVDAMDGDISVESTYEVGTSFTVTLPQYRATEEHEEAEEDSFGAESISLSEVVDYKQYLSKDDISNEALNSEEEDKKLTSAYIAPNAHILAVDDNSANLVVVRELLKKTKANFESVSGGAEAIEKCKYKKYDIILMDHMMPAPDGIETMHIIRNSLESINRHSKILMLTANAVGDDCRERYINEGFDDFMSKPVDREILLKMVRKYLNPKLVEEITVEDTLVSSKSAESSENANEPSINANEPSIENIIVDNEIMDVAGMLKRFEGNQDVANMILAECIKEGRKKIPLLKELFETGDIPRYAVEAHGVKGVMASVCANKFSAHAKEHEFAGKENRVDFIKDDIDSFLMEYQQVLDFIIEYLGKQGIVIEAQRVIEKDPGSTESVADLVVMIEDALNDFDVDRALSLIDKVESIADDEIIGTIEEVRSYTDDFEYDKAKEVLATLK